MGSPDGRCRVSFGLPVRDGEPWIRRCLDSILAQDLEAFELVVCDNASTDGTRAILQEYAARDVRVRLFLNQEDVGQIENVNRVFRLASAGYFRWISADDWLEPGYASRCVEVLDRDPGAIAVTTEFRIHLDDGSSIYEEYRGERVDSERPERRFARMLWFMQAGDAKLDPVYSMTRRAALECTPLIRMMDSADQMLAAELSLLGRYQHVPECLAHRRKAYELYDRRDEALMRRYNAQHYQELFAPPRRQLKVLRGIVRAAPLGPRQRAVCHGAAFRFFLKAIYQQERTRFQRFRRQRLGLTREALRRLPPLRR